MAQIDRIAGYVGDIAMKLPCRVATTGNITLSGLQTIDGVALSPGDRVLVRAQTNGVENGIWVAADGAWSRPPDFDGTRDVVRGTHVGVIEGDTYAGYWFMVSTSGTITPGATPITFALAISGSEAAAASAAASAAAAASSAAAAEAAVADHIADPSAAHAASAISNTPAGGITATDVQAALNGLDTRITALAGSGSAGFSYKSFLEILTNTNLTASQMNSAAVFMTPSLTLVVPDLLSVTDNSTLTVMGGAYGGTVALSGSGLIINGAGASFTSLTIIKGEVVVFVKSGTNLYIVNREKTVKPQFMVNQAGLSQSIPANTVTKLQWPTVVVDTNSNFANDRFTPTIPGQYQLNAAVYYSYTELNKETRIYIYKNGNIYKQIAGDTSGTAPIPVSSSISCLADANGTTDYFEVYVWGSFSSVKTIHPHSSLTFFEGYLVG